MFLLAQHIGSLRNSNWKYYRKNDLLRDVENDVMFLISSIRTYYKNFFIVSNVQTDDHCFHSPFSLILQGKNSRNLSSVSLIPLPEYPHMLTHFSHLFHLYLIWIIGGFCFLCPSVYTGQIFVSCVIKSPSNWDSITYLSTLFWCFSSLK